MLKITLLKNLYCEIQNTVNSESDASYGKNRHFHTIHHTYEITPEIKSITVEERYLPYSTLYFIWINDEKKEADFNNISLLRWILSFYKEYHPEYLCKDISPEEIKNLNQLLICFNVDAIPSYRDNRAYEDLELTTMKDIKNGIMKKDSRQATFPGMTFSEKYRKGTDET